MLEWYSPAWFFALPVALLPWIAWWRPHALRFSAVGLVSRGWTVREGLSLARPLLLSVALGLLVVGLARPQRVDREIVRESDGVDILLAIDTSGSMGAADMGSPMRPITRLDAARLVMRQFIESRPYDRLGLLVFGEEAFVQVPLTTDHDGLLDFVADLNIGLAGRSATAVGDAVAVACKRMKELDAPAKVVILVTDGLSNAGLLRPQQAADAAAALGIRVYTIGVGGDQMDERQLRAIAATTDAKFFRASGVTDLAKVYDEIDRMEKTTAAVKEFVHRDELYLNAVLPGLACFLLELLLGHTLLRRLP